MVGARSFRQLATSSTPWKKKTNLPVQIFPGLGSTPGISFFSFTLLLLSFSESPHLAKPQRHIILQKATLCGLMKRRVDQMTWHQMGRVTRDFTFRVN
jgi:hypothetical protein